MNRHTICLALPAVLMVATGTAAGTALDDYVAAADPNYSYSVSSASFSGYTVETINMTSQMWRTTADYVNVYNGGTALWQHYLTVIVPDVIEHDEALLVIAGGSNYSGSPGADPLQVSAALSTGSIVAELRTVPNQPLQFTGEGFTRTEDEIIAKTFREFLDGGDDE